MVPSPPPIPHHGCLFLLFPVWWGTTIADKACKVTVLLEDFSKMVNFLLKVVLHVDNPSGPVVETSHHTSLHVPPMMGLEVEILVWSVCVGFL